jgi:MFS transporter, FHS family, Na+ dependent glucose transporter 1
VKRSSPRFSFNLHSRDSLAGYFTTLASVGLIAGAFGPTLSYLAANTHTTLQGISVIFVAFPIGYMAGALFAGRILDRLPGHPVIVLSAVFCSLTLFLTPLISSLTVLVLVMGLLGFSKAGLDVGANTLLGWVYGDKVGPYMNTLHFFFGVGAIISPLVVAQILKWTGGVTWAFWILALLMWPVAIWLWRIPSPPSIHSHPQAKKRPVNWPLLSLFMLFFLLYSGLELGYGNWICNYAKAMRLEDEIHAAYLASVFWGALTFGRLIGIPIAARVGPAKILAMDVLGCSLSIGAILLWSQSIWVLWAGTAGAGLFMASIFATLMTFGGRSLAMTGQITSSFFIAASVGAIIFPWLIGQWFESVGPQVLIQVLLIIMGLMALVFIALALTTSSSFKKRGSL